MVRSSSDFVARGRQRQRESETKRVSFTAPVLILNVYRPPSSNSETDTSLATCIENVDAQNKKCFVLGDFNINTLYVHRPPTDFLKAFTPLVSVKWLINQLEAMLRAQQKDLLRLPQLSTKSTFPTSTILIKSMFPMSPSVAIILYLLSDDAMPVFVRERMLILLSIRDRSRTLTKRSLKKI